MKQKKLIWKQVTKNSLPPLILDFFIRELKNTFLRKLGFYYKYYKKVGDKGYIVPEADKEFVDELRKRARKDKNYLWNIYNMQYKDAKNLIDFSEELSKDNFKIKSDEELKQCFIQLRNNFFNYSYSLFLSVPRAPFLEDIVKKQLHKKLSNKKKIDEYFNVLMTPDKESNTGKAQKELLRIASSKNITKKLINSFLKKYSFLNVRFGYGKPYTYDDIVKRIVFLKRESPEKKLLELNTKNEELKEKRKKIIQELEFDEKLIDIINLARENSFFRTYNLETYSYVGCILIPFFNEVGKRVGLSYDELFYCTADEIISLLNNRIEIDNRKNSFVFAFLDGEANIFTGEKISFFEEKEIVDTSKFVFKGITASKGVVKGKARIVKSREDFSKMNAGDILVTEFTTPDYVTVMEKAAAIIADLGGLTSHTAVVARELGKPCIVGLVDASKVIKDDDIIEVDADKGLVIRKLNMKKLSTGDCKMNLFMYLFAKGFGKPQEKIIGYGHKNLVIVFNDKRTRFYMDPDELKEVGQLVISKMNNDFGFGMKIIEQHLDVGNSLLSLCKIIYDTNLRKLSNKELKCLLMNYFDVFQNFSGFHLMPVSLEKEMAKKARSHLQSKVKEVDDVLITLTIPNKETNLIREKKDLLNIAIYVKKNNLEINDKKITELLKKHKEKYEWMSVTQKYSVYQLEHFVEELKKLLEKNPEDELKKLIERPEQLEKERDELLKNLDLSSEIRNLIDTLREFSYMRDFKRDTGYKSHYYMEKLWVELGRRAKLSPEHIKYCVPDELIGFLNHDTKLDKKVLEERMRYQVLAMLDSKIHLFIGDKAREFEEAQIDELMVDDVDSVKGMCASKGYAKGIVKLILKPEEISKVEKGDVLVAVNTEPAMVPGMENASAIVTDEGGVTCHAAIVSRELGKPCVIGTAIATKVFKDGDLVEVNADKGVIRKL